MNSRTHRSYRYFEFVTAAFVTVLLCSNLIGPAKICVLFGVQFGAGNLFFPFSYIFGDILTEVYGYARARRAIWCGFAALCFASLMSWIVVEIPSAGGSPFQDQLQGALILVFGSTPRIVAASIFAFWLGEFVNSYVLARMKVWSGGRGMSLRFIASTVAGQAVDSMVFYPLAFYGTFTNEQLFLTMGANFALKVGWEALLTPITTRCAEKMKKLEGEDFYDRTTNFSPFRIDS